MEDIRKDDKETIENKLNNNLFFTFDFHFGHRNIIKYSDRKFNNVIEMNDKLIENYNLVVPINGICIFVGDCFFCPKNVSKNIMRRLNGRKILVLGNHDKKPSFMMNLGFDFVCYSLTLNIAHHPVIVSHYPWRKNYDETYKFYKRCPVQIDDDYWLIHGHVHEKWRQKDNMINVCVDAWDKPLSLTEIEKIIQKGPDFIDRYGNSFNNILNKNNE